MHVAQKWSRFWENDMHKAKGKPMADLRRRLCRIPCIVRLF